MPSSLSLSRFPRLKSRINDVAGLAGRAREDEAPGIGWRASTRKNGASLEIPNPFKMRPNRVTARSRVMKGLVDSLFSLLVTTIFGAEHNPKVSSEASSLPYHHPCLLRSKPGFALRLKELLSPAPTLSPVFASDIHQTSIRYPTKQHEGSRPH